MKLVHLRLRKKNKRTRGRDICNEWLSMKDAVTGNEEPLHYGKNCLVDDTYYDERFYGTFFNINNQIVSSIRKLGLEEFEGYGKFFELGMRAIQQLDGRVKEITKEKYRKTADTISIKIVKSAEEIRKKRLEARFDFLVQTMENSRVSDEDKQAAREIIASIKDFEEKREKPELVRHEESYYLTGYGYENLDLIVSLLMRDAHKDLCENIEKVPDELKFKFLRLATVHFVNDSPEWFGSDFEGLLQTIDKIGIDSSKRYLDYLYSAMQTENAWEHRSYVDIMEQMAEIRELSEQTAVNSTIDELGKKLSEGEFCILP